MKKKIAKIKTIQQSKLSTASMLRGGEKKISRVILGGHVHMWVGFGWVDEGKPTPAQLRTIPVVQADMSDDICD